MAGRKEKLLSGKEKSVCQSIVSLKKGLASKRAAVLLAVDAGLLQQEAADQAGLTIGQLRYALTLFKNKKLAIFSDELRSSVVSTIKKPAAAKKAKTKKAAKKKSKSSKESKGKDKKKTTKKSKKKSKKKKSKKKK